MCAYYHRGSAPGVCGGHDGEALVVMGAIADTKANSIWPPADAICRERIRPSYISQLKSLGETAQEISKFLFVAQ
jgi:hypothetical protein